MIIQFTSSLEDKYQQLWDTCEITRNVDYAARKIIAGRSVYEKLQARTGVPWIFIGALHMRESSCNFGTHLHNGDSLSRRTRHEPKGRPKAPPANGTQYTWLESALDALEIKGLVNSDIAWTIPRILYEGERYNGFGYRNPGKPLSPYLWAGTNHYTKGKYIADHRYSSSAVDQQPGIVPLMKKVQEITGATSITGSRSSWWTSLFKWAFPAGGAGIGILNQFTAFLTDWRTLTVLLVFITVVASAAFWVLGRQRLREFIEGRYIPSDKLKHGEIINVLD